MNFKTILACAVLLIGIGTATAAVESDIVGYTTITMEAGKWYQVGCPFDGLDETVTPSLVSIFNTGFEEGDKAYIYSEQDGTYSITRTWGTPTKGGDATWLTSRGVEGDVELPTGQAIFIKKASTSDVTFAGKVETGNVVSFGNASKSTWAQIIYPYPVDVDLNDMAWEGLSQGDVVHIYDSQLGTYNISRTWTVGKDTDTELKWRNSRGNAVATLIPAGTAMFIQKKTPGEATLSVATLSAE